MKRSMARILVPCLAVVLALASTPALAEYGPKLELDELGAASAAVVLGRVYSVDAAWGDVGNIYTYVRVDVDEVVSGPAVPDRIVIKQLGGVVGDLGLYVGGAPAWRPGEEVMLFLVLRPRDRTVYTAAFWQGKWNVDRSAGAVRVHRNAGYDHSGAPVLAETVELRTMRDAVASVVRPRAPAADEVAWVPAETPPAVNTVDRPSAQKFSLLGFSWHQVFAGDVIPLNFHKTKQPGVGNGKKQAIGIMNAWNAVSKTSTVLAKGKKKGGAATGSDLRGNGDPDILLQNLDPLGEISDTDGTLAVGGAWAGGPAIRGLVPAGSGFIIMNDGQQAFLSNKNCYTNVATHEGGHAVGQGHSNKVGNLMFPSVTFGSCTGGIIKLGKDDQKGHRKMYHQKYARSGQ